MRPFHRLAGQPRKRPPGRLLRRPGGSVKIIDMFALDAGPPYSLVGLKSLNALLKFGLDGV
jgi:hypothetical protein